MSIFENAVSSIKMGIEDFESIDASRALSSVRNIFSGLVLLYKSKLWELSPEKDQYLLISKNIKYNFDGKGISVSSRNPNQEPSKTINTKEIKERFKAFDIKVDWKLFDQLLVERNNIEHFYTSSKPYMLRKTINDAFILINDFFDKQLDLDVNEVLGRHCWNILINNNQIYQDEKKKCLDSLKKIDVYPSFVKPYLIELVCDKCGSDLVYFTEGDHTELNCIELSCKSCGDKHLDIVRIILDDINQERFDFEESKLGLYPIANCPSCGEESFVKGENVCLSCLYEPSNLVCKFCETEYEIEDLDDDSVCTWCNHGLGRL